MLRRSPVSRPSAVAGLAVAKLTVAGLAVALLTGGVLSAPAAAGPPTRPAVQPPVTTGALAATQAGAAVADVADVLTYVPADAQLVGVLEAKALLENPALAPVVAPLRGAGERDGQEAVLQATFGLNFADVERVAAYVGSFEAPNDAPDRRPQGPTFVIRTVGAAPDPATRPADGPATLVRLDARTLLYAPDGLSEPTAKPARSAADLPLLDAVRGDGMAVYLDVAAIRPAVLREIDGAMRGRSRPETLALMTVLRPLVVHTDAVATGLTLETDGSVSLTTLAESPDEDAAARVLATTRAAVTLAGNALETLAAPAGDGPRPPMGVLMMTNAASKVLDSVTLTADGSRTRLTASTDQSAPLIAAAVLPAVLQARAAARRARSMNNLKQLGLAMHNYYSVHNHFPPATVVENGVKRSWRIELLPYLDHGDLWERYDKTKPWDDPANAAVLAAMPDVFRHPADSRDEPFASYFAVLATNAERTRGPGGGPTAWTPEGARDDGAEFRDVRDGTVNTLLIVTAKQPTPWTKPEDLTYDAKLPAEKADWREPLSLGGFEPEGFGAAFVDGSVRQISDSLDNATLRALFTRNGGEVIDVDLANPAPRSRPRPVEAPREPQEAPGY